MEDIISHCGRFFWIADNRPERCLPQMHSELAGDPPAHDSKLCCKMLNNYHNSPESTLLNSGIFTATLTSSDFLLKIKKKGRKKEQGK